jgi:hypothetical protein
MAYDDHQKEIRKSYNPWGVVVDMPEEGIKKA